MEALREVIDRERIRCVSMTVRILGKFNDLDKYKSFFCRIARFSRVRVELQELSETLTLQDFHGVFDYYPSNAFKEWDVFRATINEYFNIEDPLVILFLMSELDNREFLSLCFCFGWLDIRSVAEFTQVYDVYDHFVDSYSAKGLMSLVAKIEARDIDISESRAVSEWARTRNRLNSIKAGDLLRYTNGDLVIPDVNNYVLYSLILDSKYIETKFFSPVQRNILNIIRKQFAEAKTFPTNQEIATMLSLTHATIEIHIANILKKQNEDYYMVDKKGNIAPIDITTTHRKIIIAYTEERALNESIPLTPTQMQVVKLVVTPKQDGLYRSLQEVADILECSFVNVSRHIYYVHERISNYHEDSSIHYDKAGEIFLSTSNRVKLLKLFQRGIKSLDENDMNLVRLVTEIDTNNPRVFKYTYSEIGRMIMPSSRRANNLVFSRLYTITKKIYGSKEESATLGDEESEEV